MLEPLTVHWSSLLMASKGRVAASDTGHAGWDVECSVLNFTFAESAKQRRAGSATTSQKGTTQFLTRKKNEWKSFLLKM